MSKIRVVSLIVVAVIAVSLVGSIALLGPASSSTTEPSNCEEARAELTRVQEDATAKAKDFEQRKEDASNEEEKAAVDAEALKYLAEVVAPAKKAADEAIAKFCKLDAPPLEDSTDADAWPDLPTAALEDPGPGRCFPDVLGDRREMVASGAMNDFIAQNGSVDFRPPYSAIEIEVLQDDIVDKVIREGNTPGHEGCLDDLATWIKEHEDYTNASAVIGREFDPTKREDLALYFSKLELVELLEPMAVQNHYFDVTNGVQPYRQEKLPAGELVFFVPGFAPGDGQPLRPVAKLVCGNPLLPPVVIPPCTENCGPPPPPCTENCEPPPPCTENCGPPPCVVNCGPPPCRVNCGGKDHTQADPRVLVQVTPEPTRAPAPVTVPPSVPPGAGGGPGSDSGDGGVPPEQAPPSTEAPAPTLPPAPPATGMPPSE